MTDEIAGADGPANEVRRTRRGFCGPVSAAHRAGAGPVCQGLAIPQAGVARARRPRCFDTENPAWAVVECPAAIFLKLKTRPGFALV